MRHAFIALGCFLLLTMATAPAIAQDDAMPGVAFRSGPIAPNDSWSHTFDEARVYPYHDHVAASVQGAVTVEPALADHEPTERHVAIREGDPEDKATWSFFPANLTIMVGDTVTWTNGGANEHEIMGFEGAEAMAHMDHEGYDHGHDHAHDDTQRSPGPNMLPAISVALAALIVAPRR